MEKRHTISRKEMEVVRERKGVKSSSRIVCYNKTVNFLEGGERGESDRLDGRPWRHRALLYGLVKRRDKGEPGGSDAEIRTLRVGTRRSFTPAF